MSTHIPDRRSFLKVACAASSLSFMPRFSWACGSEAERTAWYRNAKFGMFIHWGAYSVAGVEASWPIITPSAYGNVITDAEYEALPKRFNPTKFDPNAFVDLARMAGQKYMVFTAKHHDGFCMFDSAYTDYKITNTPYGKDILKQLADACDARGMPLGLYYSPPDLHHPGYRDTSKPVTENYGGEPMRPQWPLYLDYMQLQLTELLTKYGPVALVWFDNPLRQQVIDGTPFGDLIRRLQPAALVNDRLVVPGDFSTPEQTIPDAVPTREAPLGPDSDLSPARKMQLRAAVPKPEDFRLWETCMTINGTWAYGKDDRDFKSSRFLIRALVEVASRGGNFLLDVGPRPDGTIQPEFQERLRAIGKWLEVNGDSIYGTTYGPIQGLSSIRLTATNDTIYVHVFDWPSSSLEINGLKPKVLSAYLLAGGQPLQFRQSEGKLRIETPSRAPDPNVSVICLRV